MELQREQGEMMKVPKQREKRLEVLEETKEALEETNEALTIIASREIEEKLRGESNWVFDKLHHY